MIIIGNSQIRMEKQQIFEQAGIRIATLIYYPSAVIEQDVTIGAGTVIMVNAVVNSASKIGKDCIINTVESVDHDNQIEDYVHVSIGSHLTGAVFVGKHTWIGAGAGVVKDIIQKGIYIRVPARLL